MGWSHTEDLLCVQEDGVVLVYDMFLNFKRTFGMGQVGTSSLVTGKVLHAVGKVMENHKQYACRPAYEHKTEINLYASTLL